MNRATALAAGGVPEGTVVVADFQRQGRGTHGRTWSAPAGTCLMFSVLLMPDVAPSELSNLPSRLGCAIRDTLNDRLDLNASVKPPNDIMVGGNKLAGILCQSHIRAGKVEWVVCGIGLNTNLTSEQRSVPNSTSLTIETGDHYRHEELLDLLLASLEAFRRSDSGVGALAQAET
ncbi:hypothetical protein BH23CHL2_BH23CHL2_11410 [soil metagenome]